MNSSADTLRRRGWIVTLWTRGAIAVGRLVPFGVGMVLGGGFNLATMKAFKKAAMRYFAVEAPMVYVNSTDT